MKDSLFIFLQHCVPQHALSRAVGILANTKFKPIKNLFIKLFIRKYEVDMSEAEKENHNDYLSFNDFFTRSLKTGARSIDSSPSTIVSPADGCFSQLGTISSDKLFQAKGHEFSLEDLLARKDLVDIYRDGNFATIYLSPKDYHRVHMPFTGRLNSTSYIPGDLFSVNDTTAKNVENLFARNERLVCHFETSIGPMCVILVGAMIVAGIETVWDGQVAPAKTRHIVHTTSDENIDLEKGEELGRFKLGSTAIVLFPRGTITWQSSVQAGNKIKMGEVIGNLVEGQG
jgi:phosphatidylserine decarboxylase